MKDKDRKALKDYQKLLSENEALKVENHELKKKLAEAFDACDSEPKPENGEGDEGGGEAETQDDGPGGNPNDPRPPKP